MMGIHINFLKGGSCVIHIFRHRAKVQALTRSQYGEVRHLPAPSKAGSKGTKGPGSGFFNFLIFFFTKVENANAQRCSLSLVHQQNQN